MSKRIRQVLFILVILFLICSPALVYVCDRFTTVIGKDKGDDELKGFFDEYNIGEFSLSNWKSSGFQSSFNDYWSHNFPGRNAMIKNYNQFRYSLFSLGQGVVGSGDTIYADWAPKDYFVTEETYDGELESNREVVDTFLAQLESLNEKLELRGIYFIVFTTPNKVEYMYDEVPLKYKIHNGRTRIFDYFSQCVDQYNINYFDSKKSFSQATPVFYNTGIHTSRTAEQEMAAALIDVLSGHIDISTVSLGEIKQSNEPFWRDTDGWDLQNVYKKQQNIYYQYEEMVEEKVDNYPTILLQGGSYCEGLRKMLLENELSDVNYINYNATLFDKEDTPIVFNGDWDQLDWDNLLNTDAIVVEMNESVIKDLSNGFVEYLNNYLDKEG